MIQRIKDFLLERRIQRLNRRLCEPASTDHLIDVWNELRDAINSRSDAQVRRMESKFMEVK